MDVSSSAIEGTSPCVLQDKYMDSNCVVCGSLLKNILNFRTVLYKKSRNRKNGDVHYLLFCSRTIQIIKVSEVQKVEEMRRIGHLHLLAVTKLLKLNKSAEWFPEKKIRVI